MSRPMRLARVLAVASGATLVAAAAPALADPTFAAKPGAWENTVTASGLAIPPEVLAKMPPDKRAQVEQMTAKASQPSVRKSCVTKENIERGFMPDANSSCKVDIVSQTATKVTMKTSCTSPVPSTGTMSWEAKTPESVVGQIDQDTGGRKVHIDIVGRWLGASCEGIAPVSTGKR